MMTASKVSHLALEGLDGGRGSLIFSLGISAHTGLQIVVQSTKRVETNRTTRQSGGTLDDIAGTTRRTSTSSAAAGGNNRIGPERQTSAGDAPAQIRVAPAEANGSARQAPSLPSLFGIGFDLHMTQLQQDRTWLALLAHGAAAASGRCRSFGGIVVR